MMSIAPQTLTADGLSFAPTAQQAEIAARIRVFVEREVVPEEPALLTPAGVSWDVVMALREKAQAAGIYGPQLPTHLGGLGLDCRGCGAPRAARRWRARC